MRKVHFGDLYAQHQTLNPEMDDAIADVITKTAFVGGPHVSKFEKSFSDFCGVPFAVATSSGTTALHLVFSALGIGPGDEVITVPNTFIATAATISQTGARPVFVDVEEGSLNMDPRKLEEAITEKTKVIVPVHLYGQIANMTPIIEVAKKYGLHVVEDAAQAHGAEHNGQRAGQFGTAATFSFYPGKILGAYGDAGMVVTRDESLREKMESLANHGRTDRYTHSVVGFNYRMAGIQGAVLDIKLQNLEKWIEERRRKAALYDSKLKGANISTPFEEEYSRHVYTYYVIRSANRDALQKCLEKAGIDSIIHYPIPLHLQPAYSSLGYRKSDFKVAEKAAGEILSLPLYPELDDSDISYVTDIILNEEL